MNGSGQARPPLGGDADVHSSAARLMTAEDLADRWQVAKSWVYAATRDGRIPAVRLGRYYRYRLDAIVEFERAGGVNGQ